MTTANANAVLKEADALLAQRQTARACDLLQSVVQSQPRHAPALLMLARAYLQSGRFADAEQCALNCLAVAGDKPDLLFGLVRLLGQFLRIDEIRACVDRPRFRRESPPAVLAETAVLLSGLGDNRLARELIELSLSRDARHAPSWYVRGNLALFSGDLSAADQHYERCLGVSPNYAQAAWMQSSLTTQTPGKNHVERLRKQLRAAQVGLGAEVYLSFALFKELHDLGRHPEAWAALEYGCRAKRARLNYSPKDSEALFAALKRTRLRPATTPRDDFTPIFIVGMHRSGTTLLERILAGHSAVTDGGESYAMTVSMRRLANQAGPGAMDLKLAQGLADADGDALADNYFITNVARTAGKKFMTEKLPSNFLNVGFIADALPRAKFLHLIRDPMDTCFSNLRVLFSDAAAYSYQQEEMADYFIAYRDLMAHWRAMYPGRVLDVDFHSLTTDTERVARDVMAFCDLPFEAEALDISRARSDVATASSAQVRSEIKPVSAPAWLPYSDELSALRRRLSAAGFAG